jgi:DNA-binding transcriptional MerR regulator
MTFVSYKKASQYAKKSKIKTKRQWALHVKSGTKPSFIPARPDHVYKKSGWDSWVKFFGKLDFHSRHRNFRSYKQCKKYAISLKLENSKEWRVLYKKRRIPLDIPCNPYQTFKEFEGWGIFLGTGIVSVNRARENYLPLKDIREILKLNNVTNSNQYINFLREHKEFKYKMPFVPTRAFPKVNSWTDFFGFKPIRNRKNFVSFEEAKQWAREHGIKSATEWNRTKLPENIPSSPSKVYA